MSIKKPNLTIQDLNQLKILRDQSIVDLSHANRVLLVFLRHFGCSFCREALSDLLNLEGQFESRDIKLVLIHMEPKEVVQNYLDTIGLKDVILLSDPSKYWYQRFGLEKGSFSQMYGFKNLFNRRAINHVTIESLGYTLIADKKQMPGVFVIEKGEIINSYYHYYPSDRPDYISLVDV